MHYILTREKHTMLYKICMCQWNNPVKNDWTEQLKCDLKDFGICEDFTILSSIKKDSFKNLVNTRTKEYAFKHLTSLQKTHSKLKMLSYDELKLQSYFSKPGANIEQIRHIFYMRTRMLELGENFCGSRKQVFCPL